MTDRPQGSEGLAEHFRRWFKSNGVELNQEDYDALVVDSLRYLRDEILTREKIAEALHKSRHKVYCHYGAQAWDFEDADAIRGLIKE